MKAILINSDKSLSYSDVADPVCKPGEVLIKVAYAALNRADLMQRDGDYPPPPGAPEWMGLEVSGEIVGRGDGAKHFSVGDKVCALLGGGSTPRPGEVTLAHNGVLFLDELPEFERATLEMLRQPLEDGEVSISRVRAAMTFPSKFILCAAQNPCPCGFLGDSVHRCSCKQSEIDSYRRKISGPLMDRIDMQINLSRVEFSELKTKEKGESSAAIRERVVKARLVQQERLEAVGIHCNAQMGRSEVVKYCQLDAAAQNVMERYFNMLNLSARSHDRILKVARTIADLAGSESIEAVHLAEAIQLRTSVRP